MYIWICHHGLNTCERNLSELASDSISVDDNFYKLKCRLKTHSVRSGIRTHAYRSRLRPERSALDHSAILTVT